MSNLSIFGLAVCGGLAAFCCANIMVFKGLINSVGWTACIIYGGSPFTAFTFLAVKSLQFSFFSAGLRSAKISLVEGTFKP